MAGVWGGHGEDAGQRGPPEVIVHVEHVGEQRLGGRLLDVKLLHLLRHHDCLPRDLLPGPSHLHQPRQPLEKNDVDIKHQKKTMLKIKGNFELVLINC